MVSVHRVSGLLGLCLVPFLGCSQNAAQPTKDPILPNHAEVGSAKRLAQGPVADKKVPAKPTSPPKEASPTQVADPAKQAPEPSTKSAEATKPEPSNKPAETPKPEPSDKPAEAPKPPPKRGALIPQKLSSKQLSAIEKDRLLVFGKDYDAQKHCPKETSVHAEGVEMFSIHGRPGYLVILCSGSLDGEVNVVSVFHKSKGYTLKKLLPAYHTYRISNYKLAKTVKKLLKKL